MAHHSEVEWPRKKHSRIEGVTFGSLVIKRTSASISTKTRCDCKVAGELAPWVDCRTDRPMLVDRASDLVVGSCREGIVTGNRMGDQPVHFEGQRLYGPLWSMLRGLRELRELPPWHHSLSSNFRFLLSMSSASTCSAVGRFHATPSPESPGKGSQSVSSGS